MKGFLLDEHVSHILQELMADIAPDIPVYVIGDHTAPSTGTLDPDILLWVEERDCMLITNNRASMPVHLKDHLLQGRHIPGIVQLPKQIDFRQIIDDLVLLWGAMLPDEFRDQIVHLPLRR